MNGQFTSRYTRAEHVDRLRRRVKEIIDSSRSKIHDPSSSSSSSSLSSHRGLPEVTLVEGQFYFLEEYAADATWVQWVRHPVPRLHSLWYYALELYGTPHGDWLSFSDCTLLNKVEKLSEQQALLCNKLWSLVPCSYLVDYFCGYSEVCETGSLEEKYQRALNHTSYYSLIGVLEQPEESVGALRDYFRVSFNLSSAQQEGRVNNEDLMASSDLPKCVEYDIHLYEHIKTLHGKNLDISPWTSTGFMTTVESKSYIASLRPFAVVTPLHHDGLELLPRVPHSIKSSLPKDTWKVTWCLGVDMRNSERSSIVLQAISALKKANVPAIAVNEATLSQSAIAKEIARLQKLHSLSAIIFIPKDDGHWVLFSIQQVVSQTYGTPC